MASSPSDIPKPDSDEYSGDVDPRISLANERTFLAWIRTALALMAAGVAVAQVLATSEDSIRLSIVGACLILFGAVIAVLSYRRWDRNERRFAAHLSLERSSLPGLLTGLMVLIAGIALILALWFGR